MTTNLSKDLALLKKEGFLFVRNFLSPADLGRATQEFDGLFKEIPIFSQSHLNSTHITHTPDGYSGGKHLVVNRSSYQSIPNITDLFNSEWARSLVNGYCGANADFMMQVFMSEESVTRSSKEEWDRNNWLHFDPYPSIKFLLYLTDVDETTGASGVITGSRPIGRSYREKLNLSDNSGLHGGCPHRLEDWEEHPSYSNECVKFATLKAGGLLVLDTDVLHCGGIMLKPDTLRKCVIIHNRPLNLIMPSHEQNI
jgi:hypothetical protein